MIKKIERALVVSLSTGAVVVALTTMTSGVAEAGERGGCTKIASGAGALCVTVSASSTNSIKSYGGDFVTSSSPIVRPKLVVDVLFEDSSVGLHAEQSWANDRLRESITREVNMSFARPFARVCATLFEAGERVNTACTPVPSQ